MNQDVEYSGQEKRKTMMVPVSKLKPGIEVARAVVNLNKTVLLPAGTTLTAEHLRALKTWGIDAIHVLGAEGGSGPHPAEASLAPRALRAAEERVNRRFKHVTLDNSTAALIRKLAVHRTAARLANATEADPGVNA